MSSPEYNFLDFQFNCQLPRNSKYFAIIRYYKEQLNRRRDLVRGMILESAYNFWQPLVTLSLDQERQRAIDESVIAIYKLTAKVDNLIEEYELNPNEESVPFKILSPSINFQFKTRLKKLDKIQLGYYLRSTRDFNPVEKVLWSSDAFWGVNAYLDLDIDFSEEQIQKKALDCVKALNQHCQLLQRMFFQGDSNQENDFKFKITGGQNKKLNGMESDEEALIIGNQLFL